MPCLDLITAYLCLALGRLLGMFIWPWIRLLGEDVLLTRLAYR